MVTAKWEGNWEYLEYFEGNQRQEGQSKIWRWWRLNEKVIGSIWNISKVIKDKKGQSKNWRWWRLNEKVIGSIWNISKVIMSIFEEFRDSDALMYLAIFPKDGIQGIRFRTIVTPLINQE